jgi:hypothetical protein
MKIEVTPFKARDLDDLAIQSAQEDMFRHMSAEQMRAFESLESWTTRIDDRVLLIGGLVPLWEGRAMLWSYVSKEAGAHFLLLTKGVRRFIDASTYKRIEMYVDMEFTQGHRWAKVLGFTNETPDGMKAFFPNGHDAALYARAR